MLLEEGLLRLMPEEAAVELSMNGGSQESQHLFSDGDRNRTSSKENLLDENCNGAEQKADVMSENLNRESVLLS